MDFLSALCVCNGRPIAEHQGTQLKLLYTYIMHLYSYILDYIVENLLYKYTKVTVIPLCCWHHPCAIY